MESGAFMNERRVKRFFHGLRKTVVHPQWLVFRRDEKVRRWLGSFATGRVLDIGCSDCVMAGFMASGSNYVGLDYPETALDWYQSRPHVFGDANQLPFSHGSFNCVLLLDVLEHLSDPHVAIGEAWRVLGSDGILILKVPFLYPLHDAPRDFQRWTTYGLRLAVALPNAEIIVERNFGTPLETAGLLTNLAWAKTALGAMRRRSLWCVPILLLLPVLVIIENLIGALASTLSKDVSTMPSALCLIVRKTTALTTLTIEGLEPKQGSTGFECGEWP